MSAWRGRLPRRRRILDPCGVLLALLCAAGGAQEAGAGGIRDLADAWLVPAARLLDGPPTGEEPGEVPGEVSGKAPGQAPGPGGAGGGGWSVGVAHGRLFGLDPLAQRGLSLRHRAGPWRLCARWERLGRDLYREDLAAAELLLGQRWRLGGQVVWQRLALAGAEARRHVTVDLRLEVSLPGGLQAALWWPLAGVPPWYGMGGLRRWLRLDGGHRAAWAVAIDRQADGEPVIQAEIMLALVAGIHLGLRAEPRSATTGLVTSWRVAGLLLRSSHLAHPELGVTHRWGLELGSVR